MPYLLRISCWHYVGNFPNWRGRKGWCVHKGEDFFFPCGISHFLEQFEGGKWYLYPFCQMSLVATRARIKYLSIKFFLKFLSASWLATHSENWENWLSSTAILNQQSSPNDNYLWLWNFLMEDKHTESVKRKQKTNKKKSCSNIF